MLHSLQTNSIFVIECHSKTCNWMSFECHSDRTEFVLRLSKVENITVYFSIINKSLSFVLRDSKKINIALFKTFQMPIKVAANMYYTSLFWILIFILIDITGALHDDYRTIETNNGFVRGKRGTALFNHISYYSFKGIPYAKAPVGGLRFKVNMLKSFDTINITFGSSLLGSALSKLKRIRIK